jgi:hypothetical protein
MNWPHENRHERKYPCEKIEQAVPFYVRQKGMKHYPVELKLEAVGMFYEEGKTHCG